MYIISYTICSGHFFTMLGPEHPLPVSSIDCTRLILCQPDCVSQNIVGLQSIDQIRDLNRGTIFMLGDIPLQSPTLALHGLCMLVTYAQVLSISVPKSSHPAGALQSEKPHIPS